MPKDLCLFLANPMVHLKPYIRKAFPAAGGNTLVSIKFIRVKRGNILYDQTD